MVRISRQICDVVSDLPRQRLCRSQTTHQTNGSFLGRPQNRLRRSVNVSNNGPYQEHGSDQGDSVQDQVTVANNFPGPSAKDEPPPAKRKKSLRQRLSSRRLSVPKTRRQRKIDKAITIDNSYPRSPLSAITEFTDTASSDRVLPPATQDQRGSRAGMSTMQDVLVGRRPSCTQWPLTNGATSSETTVRSIESSLAARQSVAAGAKDIEHQSISLRSGLGQRSVSGLSHATNAPEEDLPPLPLFSSRSRGCQRLSNGSLDTVCSSVLESSSPTHEQTECVNSTDFQFRFPNPGSGPFAISGNNMGTNELIFGKSVGRSVHSSLNPGLHATGSGRHASRQAQHWTSATANEHLLRSSKDIQRDVSTRHSMFVDSLLRSSQSRDQDTGTEQHLLEKDLPQRPASVASSHPVQVNGWNSSVHRRLSLRNISSQSHAQSISRDATILETRDSFRKRKLPSMLEETRYNQTGNSGETTISPSQRAGPALRARASIVDVKGSPSLLDNRPILEPTALGHRSSYQRITSYSSSTGTPRPDSDVFASADTIPATFSAALRPTSQWPLSPTPRHSIKLNNATPPALRDVPEQHEYEHNSPMLPSPAYRNTTSSVGNILLPRKSCIKGPRSIPLRQGPFSPSQPSRAASPSPIAPKFRNRTAAAGDDLRKSVMLLRRMTSEGKLLDRNSRIYRNIGEDPSQFSTMTNLAMSPEPSSYNLAARAGSTTLDGIEENGSGTDIGKGVGGGSAGIRREPSKLQLLAPSHNSRMSLGGASIWEDVSVRGESPEPTIHVVVDSKFPMPPLTATSMVTSAGGAVMQRTIPIAQVPDPEARENHLSFHRTPQGKGLGLVFATPGSLYDGDGFLKDNQTHLAE